MKNKALFYGILCGVIIFILGFGIMNIYWVYYSNMFEYTHIPKLYDYYAATIGDGIFLPIMIASAIIYIVSGKALDSKIKKYSICLGITFAILGMIVQASWLISDNTALNWTIPKLHTFNMAGWHHALFFTLMFYLMGNVLVKILFAKPQNHMKASLQEDISYAIFWSSGIGFLFVWLFDDYSKKLDYYMLTTIMLIILYALTIVLTFKSKSKNCRRCSMLLSGFTVVYGISMIIYNSANGVSITISGSVIIHIIVIELSTLSLINIKKLTTENILIHIFTIMLPSTILASTILLQKSPSPVAFYTTMASIILISLCTKNMRADRFLLWGSMLLGLEVGIIYLHNLIGSTEKDLLNIIVNFIAGSVVYSYVKYVFTSEIIEKEEALDINTIHSEEEKKRVKAEFDKDKIKIYSFIGSVVIAAVFFVILQTFTMVEISIDSEYNINFTTSWLYILTIFFTICIMLMLKVLKKKKFILILEIVLYVFLSITQWKLFCKNAEIEIRFGMPFIFGIITLIGVPFIIAEGFVANTVKLQGAVLDIEHVISAIIIGLGNFVITAIASTIIFSKHTINIYSLLGISLGVVFSYLLIPIFIAFCLGDSEKNGENCTNSAINGVAQDGFLWSIFYIVTNIAVYFLFSNSTDWIQGVKILASTVPAMVWPLNFCMKNNARHIQQKNKESLPQPQMNALQTHLRCQNTVFFLALMPISIIVLLNEILILSESTLKESSMPMIQKLIDSYWPTANNTK